MIVPIVFCLPAVVFAVPPLVILIPATLAFGVQFAAPRVGFMAVFAAIMDGFVEARFRFFDGVLAFGPVIGLHQGCCHPQHESGSNDCCQ